MEEKKRERIDVGFVILHYLVWEETKRAVDSIIANLDTGAFHVVIVDNGSKNGSGEKLVKEYGTNEKVSVLIQSENLGFAKGNNIGFRYIKQHFEVSFIILSNNDVYLTEKQFTKKLYEEYENSRYAVLGPKIVLKNGSEDSNPCNWDTEIDEKKIKRSLHEFIKRYQLCKYRLWYPYVKVQNLIRKLTGKRKKMSLESRESLEKRHELEEILQRDGKLYNVRLHGCFWVFSAVYIEKFDGIEDRTFMYMEEEILFLIMKNEGMKMVYDPEIVVYHAEDVSTDAMKMTNRRRQMFEYRNYIRSLKVWRLIYHEYLQKDCRLDNG